MIILPLFCVFLPVFCVLGFTAKYTQTHAPKHQHFYRWRSKTNGKEFNVGYEKYGGGANRNYIILSGFGTGAFQQRDLAYALVTKESDCSVYLLDYVGQGRSWPVYSNEETASLRESWGGAANEEGVQYSARFWVEQVCWFIDGVVGRGGEGGLTLIGNSLGGFLSVHLAGIGDLGVDELVLLNPTPKWGLNLPGYR